MIMYQNKIHLAALSTTLTNLKFQCVSASVFEPDTLVMLLSTVATSVDQKTIFVFLLDTSGCVGLEIAVVLKQNRATLDMQVFPLALSPFGQLAKFGQM